METIKINQLEIENVKRIRAVKLEPTANGLTVIGGRNKQGKTSVLDTIAWALGGEKYCPSNPTREGSAIPPTINIKLSNGYIVERKGKNSDLKVTDPSGKKSGQQILNGFIEQLALDLPKFMQATARDKASILLRIIGVESQLTTLERKETELYNQRLAVGRIKDQKEKFAKEQPYYPEAPKEPVAASELIRQQQDILARNGENNRKRQNLQYIAGEVTRLNAQMVELQKKLDLAMADYETATKSALDLHDEATDELEQNITNIETINRKVRANLDKGKAEDDALEHANQWNNLSTDLDNIRKQKTDLLNGAALPLPGLSVADGELTYEGRKWDSISGADQLKVATAIVRRLNPQCGFVLLDKLEAMDVQTLKEFGQWLEAEGLQAIATRVSTGDECSIIIEDGYVVGAEVEPEPAPTNKWQGGVF